LRDAYYLARLRQPFWIERAANAIEFLRARGFDPVLIKGPAAAMLYPDRALRPFCDIDLCVDPARFDAARDALASAGELGFVDLHRGCPDLRDRTWDDLFARSRFIELGTVSARVLAEEDHLRLLALHAMKHGCFRALWLCDIAAGIESRSASFDWNLFLAGSTRDTEYAITAIVLAQDLLGADLSGTPLDGNRVPAWTIASVVKDWSLQSRWPGGRPIAATVLLSQPWRIPTLFVERFPSALESTVVFRAPINRLPRFPLQFVYMLTKLVAIPRQLISLYRNR